MRGSADKNIRFDWREGGRVVMSLMLFLAALVLLLPAHAHAGLGGEMAPSFPLVDVQTGKQEARASVVDGNGDVIVAGYQNLSGGTNDDYYIVKFKGDGSGLAWRAYYDKAGGSDVATAVAVDGNNDVVVTGYVWNGINSDIHTIKYNGATGAVLWQHTFNGAANGNDAATSVAVAPDGSVYVAGYSQNGSGNDDFLVLKYAAGGGAPVWQEIYNGAANGIDRINSIAVGTGGFAVTGSSWNGTKFEILTKKYGFDKTLIREWHYSTTATGPDTGVFVAIDRAGDVVMTGYTSNATDFDIYTAKYQVSTGNVVWQRTYDGGFEDEPKGLSIDTAGDVYITGYTWTLAGRYEFYTARYNGSNGNLIWQNLFNSGGNNDDVTVPSGIVVDEAGAVYVTGYTYKSVEGNYDIQVVKYNRSNGSQLWQVAFDGAAHRNDEPVGIGLNGAGDVLVGGWSERATDSDFLVIKFDKGVLFAPTALTAEAASDISVNLGWIDNSPDEDGFVVERMLGEAGTWSVVATLPPNTTTWTDTGLVPNNYYFYRVRAFRTGNINSLYTTPVSVLTKVVTYSPVAWSFVFNGPDNREEYAEGIAVGPDDNPVVTGRSDLREAGVDPPAFSFDYYTMKLNRTDTPTTQNPRVMWSAVYDSGDGGYDVAKSVAVNGNNDAFVTGNAYLYWPGAADNTNDIYTIKYPAAGPPEEWHHQYNGPAGGDDRSTSVATAVDGSNNIALVGYGINRDNNADIYVMKLSSNPTVDANGNATALWTAAPFNGGGDDFPTSVAFDRSGNIFVAGYTKVGSFFKWFVAKYDGANGSRLWTDVYGLDTGNNMARSIVADAAGNAYVTGYMTDAAGKSQMYTIKYDGAVSATKRRIWEKSGPGGGDDAGMVARLDPIEDGLIVAGTVLVSPDDHDFYLVRYALADGQAVWQRRFDRPGKDDHVTAMAVDSSGYLYVAGNTSNGATTDILSLIYDYAGTFLGASVYNGAANDFDEAKDVTANYRGEAFIAGYSTNGSGNADMVVLKQKNDYILVPAPFTATANADGTKMNLAWRANTPDAGFHVWRTVGSVTVNSTWTKLPDIAPGTTSLIDTGLDPNTYYCYQIDAFNGSLSSRKINACGTTTLLPPALAAPVANSTAQVTLTWGNVAGNTGYRIERKVGAGSWADLTVTGANIVTFVDNGLTAGTQYTYRISSRNVGGTSVPSAEQTVFTNPVAPVLNAPTVITTSRIDFAWNNVTGNTGYRVERKTGAADWAEVGITAANVVTFSDTGLAENTLYSYRVRASDASGYSAYSNVITPTTQLPAPTLSSAAAVSTSQVNLSWTAVPEATGYIISESSCSYSDSNPTYCTSYDWAWSGYYQAGTTTGATTFQRTGLTAGYAYRYTITTTATGTSSVASNVVSAWLWLVPPTLTVTPASETSLTLTWTNVTGETNYTVERRLGTDVTWAAVAAGTNLAFNTTTFTDTGLALQTNYCYRIHPVNTLPGGPPADVYSNEACLTTPLPAPVLSPLVVPSSTQINLAWSNVTNNTGYEVERCSLNYPNNPEYVVSYSNADWLWTCTVLTPALAKDSIGFNDTGLTAGYTYRYRVRDTYAGGTSGWSTMAYATTIPPVPTITVINSVSTSQIDLNWTDVNGDTSYKLEWKEGAGGTWTTIPFGENAWYFSHTGLKTGTVYYYRLRASNSSGDSGYSAEVSKPTLLSAPTLNTLAGITIAKVDLSWNNLSGNTGYKVQRRTGVDGSWTQIGTTGTDVASYSDTTVAAGTLYFYRVLANNAGGDSLPSNEQSATTTPAKPVVSLAAVSTTRIDLKWPVIYGATNYKIRRKTGTGGTYADLVNLPIAYAESFCGFSKATVACPTSSPVTATRIDSPLSGNTTYCYQVTAWNATGGDSVASDEKCLTTASLPSANLTATPNNPMKISLGWTPGTCTEGACDNPDGYEVERQAWNRRFTRIASVSAGSSSYVDTFGIDPATTYTYRIRPYRSMTADFAVGLDTAVWAQRGVVRNSANAVVQDVSTPPVNIVDGTNGNAQISATGGAVQMVTTSPGGGQGNTYNFTRINLAAPDLVRNDFEMSIDYSLPNGQVTKTQYHVYGRLQANFTSTSGGADSFYVERFTGGGNYYNAVFTIDGVAKTATVATSDVSGKFRITRNNGRITAAVWTNGAWSPVLDLPYASTAPATFAGVSQYTQRNESVSLKIVLDNFSLVTNRAAYSNEATAKTPPYDSSANTCR